MKTRVLFALAVTLALAACPGPRAPVDTTPRDPATCFTPVDELPAPAPAPAEWWQGELPSVSEQAIWVLAALDDQGAKWAASAVDPSAKKIEAVLTVDQKNLRDLEDKINIRQAVMIKLGSRIISIWRPSPPPPGPSGFPPEILLLQYNTASAVHVSTEPRFERKPTR